VPEKENAEERIMKKPLRMDGEPCGLFLFFVLPECPDFMHNDPLIPLQDFKLQFGNLKNLIGLSKDKSRPAIFWKGRTMPYYHTNPFEGFNFRFAHISFLL
jgi:hypothetical protein